MKTLFRTTLHKCTGFLVRGEKFAAGTDRRHNIARTNLVCVQFWKG